MKIFTLVKAAGLSNLRSSMKKYIHRAGKNFNPKLTKEQNIIKQMKLKVKPSLKITSKPNIFDRLTKTKSLKAVGKKMFNFAEQKMKKYE